MSCVALLPCRGASTSTSIQQCNLNDWGECFRVPAVATAAAALQRQWRALEDPSATGMSAIAVAAAAQLPPRLQPPALREMAARCPSMRMPGASGFSGSPGVPSGAQGHVAAVEAQPSAPGGAPWQNSWTPTGTAPHAGPIVRDGIDMAFRPTISPQSWSGPQTDAHGSAPASQHVQEPQQSLLFHRGFVPSKGCANTSIYYPSNIRAHDLQKITSNIRP